MQQFCFIYRNNLVSFAVFLLIMAILYKAECAFNCNRPGSSCVQGNCDLNNSCSCNRGYAGARCDLDLAQVAKTCPSTFRCKTRRCTMDAAGTVNGCHCDYEFYGPACDKPRYTLECFFDRMMIGVNPLGFKGHIRYVDKLTSSSCDLTLVSQLKASGVKDFSAVDWEGYGIVATHKSDACNGDATYSMTHGYDIYTRKLVVQYYDRVYVSIDEIVTFICAVENKNPVNVMKSVFTAPLESGFLDKGSVRGVGTHFVFSLHKSPDDTDITDGDTLGVGSLVFLKVKIRDHSPYATLIIESCTADDGIGTNQTQATYTFHDQGCPVAPVGQWIMKPNAKEFQLYFKIFRFEETNELRITCVVRGCTSWDSPSCSISQCSHVDRKKRETEGIERAMRKITTKRLRKQRQRHIRSSSTDPIDTKKNILLSDKAQNQENKLNSSEVIRLTVVITDKKKGDNTRHDEILVREVASPNFQACTLSFEFWILIIGLTVVVVALASTVVSCALKRRKLKNRKRRKSEKAVKLALSNMKRMQLSTMPWNNFYN